MNNQVCQVYRSTEWSDCLRTTCKPGLHAIQITVDVNRDCRLVWCFTAGRLHPGLPPSPLQTHRSMLRTCATAFWVATWVFHRPQPPSKRHLHPVLGQGPITTWADAFQRERAVISAQRHGTELRITRKCLPTAFHIHNVSISRCHLASW